MDRECLEVDQVSTNRKLEMDLSPTTTIPREEVASERNVFWYTHLFFLRQIRTDDRFQGHLGLTTTWHVLTFES